MNWPEVVATITAAIWTLAMVHMRYQFRIDTIRATSPIARHRIDRGMFFCSCGYPTSGDDVTARVHDWHQHLIRVSRHEEVGR